MAVCPTCRTRVSDDAVICDNCNAIIDAAFLGDDITNDAAAEGGATKIKAMPPTAEQTRISSKAAVEQAKTKKRPKVVPTRVEAAPEEEESTEGGARKASLSELAAPPAQSREALDELIQQFKGLPLSERLTAGGAGLLALSLAFPWKDTRTAGDLLGVLSEAWPIGIIAIGVLSGVFVRRQPKLARFRDRFLQALAGLSLFAMLLVVLFLKNATIKSFKRGAGNIFEMRESWPTFGAYLGLAAATLMAFGAVTAYLKRDQLPE